MPLSSPKITQRRQKLKLTQRQAAERAGLPPQRWNEIECGRQPNPTIARAEAVAAALRCRIDDLLLD